MIERAIQFVLAILFAGISWGINKKQEVEIKFTFAVLAIASSYFFYAGLAWLFRSFNFDLFPRESYENFILNLVISFILMGIGVYPLFWIKRRDEKLREEN